MEQYIRRESLALRNLKTQIQRFLAGVGNISEFLENVKYNSKMADKHLPNRQRSGCEGSGKQVYRSVFFFVKRSLN